MSRPPFPCSRLAKVLTGWLTPCLLASALSAQPAPASADGPRSAVFQQLNPLPPSRLRDDLERLPETARDRARRWLDSFSYPAEDLRSLHVDHEGGILYVCPAPPPPTEPEDPAPPPPVALGPVPVSPWPAGLTFHSRPGAPHVVYLNFSGETVINTAWNTDVGRSEIVAVAFSTDADRTTFSDSEQAAIKRIWQRIAEDYAPFEVDVTTERPATLTTRTAMALITRATDAQGQPNPYNTGGGVAYVNVFGTSSYAKYRPAWIYHDNLANVDSYIAEAAAHEIGHNLGLSHDGKADGTEYYEGHGTGDISWGPIMGTGYNRQVSQWCKGEYYQANNTQDDLAILAGKVAYRADDHGNTPGTATALRLTGTNIVATTPETDPANALPFNKGVLERTTDFDVFVFVTGQGPVRLAVTPWTSPAGTRGGNLDVSLELRNEAGMLLLTNNPAAQTPALLQTNLAEGRYYLYVRNAGAGNPLSASPSGYTVYGSLGQYFINGFLTEASAVVVPPGAELQAADLTQTGQTDHRFTVTYSDDVAVDTTSLDGEDIRVTGPNGYDRPAALVAVSNASPGTPRTATYSVAPPVGSLWAPDDNGTYTVALQAGQVRDTEGAFAAARSLGTFRVLVPAVLYAARMDTDPGWTLQGQWQYGTPAYGSSGPSAGFTGPRILGYNLSGNYANNLAARFATTPAIDASTSASLTLRFQRWLRTRRNDTASIQASTNGSTWITVWSTSSPVADSAWREMQYALPASVVGSPTLRLRWGLASNPSQTDLGWNLDEVELLGGGILDTRPPIPALSVAPLTVGGSPSHACSVTYTDATAVRLSSLDGADLVVQGPNGYSNTVEFIGADLPADGSPLTASYSIPAPGEGWSAADNGAYTITLQEDAVEDTLNLPTPETLLGTFEVNISAANPGVLTVVPADDWSVAGPAGGPFTPSTTTYTLSNTGGATLHWTCSQAQPWTALSATVGSLEPGASTQVVVSLEATATALPAGLYRDTLLFVNATSAQGNTSRTVDLAVREPLLNLEAEAWGETGFVLILRGPAAAPCVLEVSTDLQAWTEWLTATLPAEGVLRVTDPAATERLHRFYRARTAP